MSKASRAQRITGWVLTVLLSALFLFSAAIKLSGSKQVVEMMEKWGLGNEVTLIGVGEAVCALLFLIPRTHSLGLLLLSSYMGGAIVTHMQHGEPYYGPSIMLVVIWVTGFLRHPQVLQSFFPRAGLKRPIRRRFDGSLILSWLDFDDVAACLKVTCDLGGGQSAIEEGDFVDLALEAGEAVIAAADRKAIQTDVCG